MSIKEFYTLFNEASIRHEEKFGEPPYFQGYMNATEENLEVIEQAIRSNRPVDEASLITGDDAFISIG